MENIRRFFSFEVIAHYADAPMRPPRRLHLNYKAENANCKKGNTVNNVISFKKCTSNRKRAALQRISNNVVSFIEWKNKPRTLRTPNGIFFMTSVLDYPGTAA